MTDLVLARFLLLRLNPDLAGARLDAIMNRLEAEWHAGTSTGFSRLAADGGSEAASIDWPSPG